MKSRRSAASSLRAECTRLAASDSKEPKPTVAEAAMIAAQFMALGENSTDAARLAYSLLDSCREEEEQRSLYPLIAAAFDPENIESFSVAVRLITGSIDPDYGPKIYIEFWQEILMPRCYEMRGISAGKETIVSDVAKMIAHQKRYGVPTMMIAFAKAMYDLTKPKRRKTPGSHRKWRELSDLQ